MNNYQIPRMATIDKAAEITGLPKHLIRTKAKSGEIVAVNAGKKYLINIDKLIEYLNTSTIDTRDEHTEPAQCRITPVSVRL